MDDNVWPVYHPARGEEGRETGRMERRPSQREMGEPCQQPSLPRTPKKPLLPALLSPPQETCDLSLEAYFHHRTKQSVLTQGSLEIAHARPAPGGHGLQWISIARGGSAPLRVASLLPTTLVSLYQNGGACDVVDHLFSPPAPFYVVSFPALRPPHQNWQRGR